MNEQIDFHILGYHMSMTSSLVYTVQLLFLSFFSLLGRMCPGPIIGSLHVLERMCSWPVGSKNNTKKQLYSYYMPTKKTNVTIGYWAKSRSQAATRAAVTVDSRRTALVEVCHPLIVQPLTNDLK